MEILAKCWCERCQKWVYPRPSIHEVIFGEVNTYYFSLDTSCPYCNDLVGFMIGNYTGKYDKPTDLEVKD